MTKIYTKIINNCTECPNHKVVKDPDPYDSFCGNDVAVLCTISPNIENVNHFAKILGPFEHRPITTSCRPYNTVKESTIPDWCPLTSK